MIFIEKENVPSMGKGQRFITIITVGILLFMSTALFFNINTLRYDSNLLASNTTLTINDSIANEELNIQISKIAQEKIAEYKDIVEIDSWTFNKEKFVEILSDSRIRSNDLGKDIKNCIDLKFVNYQLTIKKDNTTFFFKSEQEAQAYQKKINTPVTIAKVANTENKITSQSELNKKYSELNRVLVAKTQNKVTSRGSVSRSPRPEHLGILPLESYVYISSGYRTVSRPNHTGIDFAANYGTKIKAFQDGTVIRASWYGGYGNCIEIDNGNGLVTRYAHCSSFNVSVGQVVSQGDIIGFVGSTGNSTGNHLHFEVIINGIFYNPLGYIK